MAIPAGAKQFTETMDPFDVLDFEVDISTQLQQGEGATSATLSIPTESTLLGLTINTTGGYTTTLIGNILRFYLSIILQEQANSAFAGGVSLPLEISIITNSVPARKKQRTVVVRVIQR